MLKTLRPSSTLLTILKVFLCIILVVLLIILKLLTGAVGVWALLLTLSTILSTILLTIYLSIRFRNLTYVVMNSAISKTTGAFRRKERVLKADSILYYTAIQSPLLRILDCYQINLYGFGIKLSLYGLHQKDYEFLNNHLAQLLKIEEKPLAVRSTD